MKKQRGMLLICVLVCLGIASTITGLTVQSGLRARRQMTRHWQLEQTRLLLDAGVRRAVIKARDDDNDWREEWDVSNAFEKYAIAKVSINTVVDDPLEEESWRITAELQTDDQIPSVTRRSRVISISQTLQTTPDSDSNLEQED